MSSNSTPIEVAEESVPVLALELAASWAHWVWSLVVTATSFLGTAWPEIKSTAWLLFALLTVLAVHRVVRRLPRIAHILREFRDSRGALWDLQRTVDQIVKLQPDMKKMIGDVNLVAAQIESLQKQINDQAIESASARVDEDSSDPSENYNWEQLRQVWRKNIDRLEFVISQIPDKRQRLSYSSMSRRTYRPIIDKLEKEGVVQAPAAQASRELIDKFNSYRRRNQRVPSEILGPLAVLDHQLDQELVRYSSFSSDEDASSTAVMETTGSDTPPPSTPVVRRAPATEHIPEEHSR